ncbi:unnamed protein product [Owenia fusiformis]|uniref:adenylate cyclase n=1 Tax=Owenia fusiformis TaxID=6347 RepID=A0A8J1XJF9_OWEFU|nr:unnamed protein product [Owenia fusiformis]
MTSESDKVTDPTVEFKNEDGIVEPKVDIKTSGTKNRFSGTVLNMDTSVASPSIFPILFERASNAWWNPSFDSPVLEAQHQKNAFPQTQRRFQYALFYIILACAAWSIFFAAMGKECWVEYVAGGVALLVFTVVILVFTYTKYYERFYLPTSILISVVICGLALSNFHRSKQNLSSMSTVGSFSGSIQILLMMYTVFPMPLYLCLIIGGSYSVVYEILAWYTHQNVPIQFTIGKALLHVCIHLIGTHIFINSQVRKRSTFWKVGQSIMARRDLEIEKQLKEKMIHSLMPEVVADEVMKSRVGEGDEQQEMDEYISTGRKRSSSLKKQKGQEIFRNFYMSKMDDVSILFADIVGFTKMSSNKTAAHLVALLNDLFGRFDVLCTKSGCEKISTLGDCYYCVSGCPEPKADHAKCCVEMGIGMIKAIQQFDEDNNEEVNMRVGVHTGTVLCGLVGTRRFKFDVWSNDVTMANLMESSGKPGRVHISECTYAFCKDIYEVEEGEPILDNRKHKVLTEDYDTATQSYKVQHVQEKTDLKTYFITGRKNRQDSSNQDLRSVTDTPPTEPKHKKEKEPVAESGEVAVEIPSDSGDLERKDSLRKGMMKNHLEPQQEALNGMSPTALLHRRGSGLYTAELALDETTEKGSGLKMDPMLVPINETLTKFRQVRDQSDIQLTKCIEENIMGVNYFYKPPINLFTLNFLRSEEEVEYRDHYLVDVQTVKTIASPRFSALFDMAISFLVMVIISVCCFMMFHPTPQWIAFFCVGMILEIAVLIPLIRNIFIDNSEAEFGKIMTFFTSWYPRHIVGVVIASLPSGAVYTNFSCELDNDADKFFAYLIVVSLLHFCNFSMFSSWMKSGLAIIAGAVLLILLSVGICGEISPENAMTTVSIVVFNEPFNASEYNNTSSTTPSPGLYSRVGHPVLRFEIILDMVLMLLLVCFLNREFEIAYRLSFHGDVEAAADKRQMEVEKDQCDWLLLNIIPEYLSETLKTTSKYSKNHRQVGVIFASIVNFSEFYEESFEGGKEYYRVLNELVADFEDLFDEERFKDIEKIKTIGSCFMAAGGLNSECREQNKNEKAHLYELMDFCLGMLEVIHQFNESIFNFDFEMAIGFNVGDVTAGVIGTTKLHYDIWGDTVNIASRMYSTGARGKIQVTEDTKNIMEDVFEFEYRGEIFVKGKGDMKTYLLVKKKDGATWD